MNNNEFKYIVKYLFKTYASYVNSKLPGIDSFKTVQRRIMYVLKNYSDYTKSAKIVGEIIGNYHPHGDGSVYSSLVNLVQRKLADGKGNWGSNVTLVPIEPAAYRYTEVRMQQQDELIKDMYSLIDYSMFVTNELNHQEPLILPSRYPLMMCYRVQNNKGDSTIGVTVVNNTYTYSVSSLAEHVKWLLDKLGDKIDNINDYDSLFQYVINYQNLINQEANLDKIKCPQLELMISDKNEQCLINPLLHKQSFEVKIPYTKKPNGNFTEYTFYYPSSRIKKVVADLQGAAKLIDKSKDCTEITLVINNKELDSKLEKELEQCCIMKDTFINTISLPLNDVKEDNIPDNYLSYNMSLSTQLLACISYYILTVKTKMRSEIEKTNSLINRKKIIKLCRDHLNKTKDWSLVTPDKLAEEISNASSYSKDDVSKAISNSSIRSLLTVDVDIAQDEKQLEQLTKQLQSCSKDIYKVVKDDTKK